MNRRLLPRSRAPRFLATLALCLAMLPFNSSAGVYVRLTITKARSGTAMQTAEFAVYDTSGTRVNLDLEKAGVNVNIAELSVGQYTVDFADNSQYNEVSTKLFDGNTGTKLYWSNVSASNPISITMRLGDAVSVGGYNFCTANGMDYRDPVSWTVEYSRNGVDWDSLDAKTNFSPTTTRYTWYDGLNGTSADGTEADYFRVTDPYDSSILRIAAPAAVMCSTPSPAYGSATVLAAGQTLAVSCGATPWTNAAETAVYSCTGWKLYNVDGNLVSSGTGTSFTYTHPNPAAYRRLEWQWAVSAVKGTVTAGANGSVSPSGTAWFSAVSPVTVTATPDADYNFLRWTGTALPADIKETSASVTFTPSAPFDMTASFATALYVAKTGNDGNPGTKAKPFATIGAAITAAGANTVVISVADGTYTEHSLTLAAPIIIVGESGNRDAVIVDANQAGRAFTLNNALATLSGITVRNGSKAEAGGNIYIGANGGIVRNCVVANGRGYYGGNIAMGSQSPSAIPPASTLVVDCVISNGTDTAGSGSWDSAGNIFSNGGRILRCVIADGYVQSGNGGGNVRLNNAKCTVENCLITGGSGGSASASLASGIAVNNNGRVVNCTIVGNIPAGTHKMAVSLWSATADAKVVNCVIYGNGDGGQNVASDRVSCFINCAFSSDGANCANTISPVLNLTDAAFEDYAAGDYRTKRGGALFNAGDTAAYTENGAISATDLDGAKRIAKDVIDIGCYEAATSAGLQIFVR